MIHLTSDAAIMYGLALVSAMLCCGFILSWRVLGGMGHALIWAAAFGIGAVQWAIIGGYNSFWTVTPVSFLGSTWAGGVVAILLCAGFRERAGAPRRLWLMGGAALLSGAAILWFYSRGLDHYILAVPQFTRALFLPVAAWSLIGPGRPASGVERLAALVLITFALFSALVGGMRLADDCGCEGNGGRAVLLVGLPALYNGTGIAAVLLLAADMAAQLRLAARLDPLTGALNRRGFEEAAERAIARVRRRDRSVSLILLDLDHFKAINDGFGHAQGDRVLRAVVDCVRREMRLEDALGRMGGEEFALLLDDTSPLAALAVAERMRVAISALDLTPMAGVTASFGVAPLFADGALGAALAHADRALYRAKSGGRDRACLHAEAHLPAESAPENAWEMTAPAAAELALPFASART